MRYAAHHHSICLSVFVALIGLCCCGRSPPPPSPPAAESPAPAAGSTVATLPATPTPPDTVAPPRLAAAVAAVAERDTEAGDDGSPGADGLAPAPKPTVIHPVGARGLLEPDQVGHLVIKGTRLSSRAILTTLYGPVVKESDGTLRSPWPAGSTAEREWNVEDWAGEDNGGTWVTYQGSFKEAGVRRRWVAFGTGTWLEPNDSSCTACAPTTGAALFTRVPGGWRLAAWSTFIAKQGRMGFGPTDFTVVRVGPNRHALRTRMTYSNFGCGNEVMSLFGAHGGQVIDMLTLCRVTADNEGLCGEEFSPCYQETSTVRFVPRPRTGPPLIVVKRKRTGEHIATVRTEQVFRLVDDRYQGEDTGCDW